MLSPRSGERKQIDEPAFGIRADVTDSVNLSGLLALSRRGRVCAGAAVVAFWVFGGTDAKPGDEQYEMERAATGDVRARSVTPMEHAFR